MPQTAAARCALEFQPWRGETRRRPSRVPAVRARWSQPLRWNRLAAGDPEPPAVLCAGRTEWLDPALPPFQLSRLLSLIRRTPRLEWVLPAVGLRHWEGRLRAVLASHPPPATARWISAWLSGKSVPANIRTGTLVRSQEEAEARVPPLLAIPSVSRFVLCSRLTGPVDLSALIGKGGPVLHRVLLGPGCPPEWAASLRAQCAAAAIPVLTTNTP